MRRRGLVRPCPRRGAPSEGGRGLGERADGGARGLRPGRRPGGGEPGRRRADRLRRGGEAGRDRPGGGRPGGPPGRGEPPGRRRADAGARHRPPSPRGDLSPGVAGRQGPRVGRAGPAGRVGLRPGRGRCHLRGRRREVVGLVADGRPGGRSPAHGGVGGARAALGAGLAAGKADAPDAGQRPQGRRRSGAGRFLDVRGHVRARVDEVGRLEGGRPAGDPEGRVDRRCDLPRPGALALRGWGSVAPDPGGDRPRAAVEVGVRPPLGAARASVLGPFGSPREPAGRRRPGAWGGGLLRRPGQVLDLPPGPRQGGGSSAPTSRAWPVATGRGSTGTSSSRTPRSTPTTSRSP